MTFVLTKPQQELVPIMTQISRETIIRDSSNSDKSHHSSSNSNHSNGGVFFGNPNNSFYLESPSKKRRRNNAKRGCCGYRWGLVLVSVLLLGAFVVLPYRLSLDKLGLLSASETESKPKLRKEKDPLPDTDPTKEPVALIHGTVGTSKISYYHQPASSPSADSTQNKHLILLHGSAFTKENWKSSGILGLFQRDFPSVAVTALDLPVSADYAQLQQLLRQMRDEDLVEELPVSGIVTPSASGKALTTFLQQAPDELEIYLKLWIPVASYSVAGCSTSTLQSLSKQTSHISTLAVYGDGDSKGKRVMKRLEKNAGATLLQLQGGHPVYLDSPHEFVTAVGDRVLALD